MQNSNAQARLKQAMSQVAMYKDVEELPGTPTVPQQKSKKLASWILTNGESPEWARRFFQQVMTVTAVANLYTMLVADNNLLTADDSQAIDDALVQAVSDKWSNMLVYVTEV